MPYVYGMDVTQVICQQNVCVANSSPWTTLYVHVVVSCHYTTMRSCRDITAEPLNEICHNVSTEPELQSLSSEVFTHRTANTKDGARLDVKAQGFWGDRHQCTFFDIQVLTP